MGALLLLSRGISAVLDGFDQNQFGQVPRVEQASAAIVAIDVCLYAGPLDTPVQNPGRKSEGLPRLPVRNQCARVHRLASTLAAVRGTSLHPSYHIFKSLRLTFGGGFDRNPNVAPAPILQGNGEFDGRDR